VLLKIFFKHIFFSDYNLLSELLHVSYRLELPQWAKLLQFLE